MAVRAAVGLLVLAMVWWMLPSGVLADVAVVEPRLEFARSFEGMFAVLCARADVAQLEVTVDGAPFFSTAQPRPGPACGPNSVGVNYVVLIGKDVIAARPGLHSVSVRVTGDDALVQSVTAPVMFATGPILTQAPILEWAGSQLRVRGWALDPDTSAPLQVTVSGYDRAGQSRETTVTANGWHQGVADRFPGYGGFHGFDVMVPIVSGVRLRVELPGYEEVRLGPFWPPDRPVVAWMDPVAVEGRRITISGSAYDPDGPVTVAVGINGLLAGVLRVGAGPETPTSAQPWSLSFPVDPGTFDICTQHAGSGVPYDAYSSPECQRVVVK